MAKGIYYTKHMDETLRKGVYENPTPNWDFLYQTSLTKDELFDVGDSVILPDRREFVYSLSATALVTGLGCSFSGTGYLGYKAVTTAKAVGVKEIEIPADTHAALTLDELRGGYVVIMLSGEAEVRQIVGNDAADANVAFNVQLDAAISVAITTSSATEVYKNPFGAMTASGDVALAKAGVPATTVAAGSTYFWCQVKGPTFISPQAGVTGKQRSACWRHDGSIDTLDNGIEDSAFVSSQIAGITMIGEADGNGPILWLGNL